MTKRSGHDRRLSIHFAPDGAERRAYRDRRGEPKETQQPLDINAEETSIVETSAGPMVRGKKVFLLVLIVATVLLVSL